MIVLALLVRDSAYVPHLMTLRFCADLPMIWELLGSYQANTEDHVMSTYTQGKVRIGWRTWNKSVWSDLYTPAMLIFDSG